MDFGHSYCKDEVCNRDEGGLWDQDILCVMIVWLVHRDRDSPVSGVPRLWQMVLQFQFKETLPV